MALIVASLVAVAEVTDLAVGVALAIAAVGDDDAAVVFLAARLHRAVDAVVARDRLADAGAVHAGVVVRAGEPIVARPGRVLRDARAGVADSASAGPIELAAIGRAGRARVRVVVACVGADQRVRCGLAGVGGQRVGSLEHVDVAIVRRRVGKARCRGE